MIFLQLSTNSLQPIDQPLISAQLYNLPLVSSSPSNPPSFSYNLSSLFSRPQSPQADGACFLRAQPPPPPPPNEADARLAPLIFDKARTPTLTLNHVYKFTLCPSPLEFTYTVNFEIIRRRRWGWQPTRLMKATGRPRLRQPLPHACPRPTWAPRPRECRSLLRADAACQTRTPHGHRSWVRMGGIGWRYCCEKHHSPSSRDNCFLHDDIGVKTTLIRSAWSCGCILRFGKIRTIISKGSIFLKDKSQTVARWKQDTNIIVFLNEHLPIMIESYKLTL